ncbi:nitrous oxide-stimulated promoter family protein [Ferrimonas sediminicola]|uniref:Nitrous oxide-stimulated promoter family protein n=1 Tax=Ferrimonas sediminicola TaxID=2569538 RepID=A0A4U1BIX0_9GAMM|nr:nitrous oxide-stimulated promoter family protein [Ferrimonas sediminicola]TKB51102.1 nitrous oxide-stimulated promoter family protein [Ferrimonas sediminicola]
MKSANLTGRLAREHRTMAKMTRLYCQAQCDGRRNDAGVCPACDELLAYAEQKLDRCPYGEEKPTCGNCPIHCYKPAQRQQARGIMRYAGPRMVLRHPLAAVQHILDSRRPVPERPPMQANRRRRSRPRPLQP